MMNLSVGLAGDVPVRDHLFEVWPEDVDPLGQGQGDPHRLLQTLLDGSLTPGDQHQG